MTDSERKQLRDLQNRWLALPHVRRMIDLFGWDDPIALSFDPEQPWPTYREIRDVLHPDMRSWFEDFFRGNE